MGHYSVKTLGGFIYWFFTGMKKDKKECINYKYSFEIGILTILIATFFYLYII